MCDPLLCTKKLKMGGGDLNLKKSWHPLTMQNLERVWKAEQRDEAERKRIAELQAEIREERAREEMQQMAVESGVMKARDERVDWLYKGPGTVNRDEYLLGKPIDKAVDPTLIEEEREKQALESGPGALFASIDTSNTSIDLEVKIREDPLFIIRKREEEAKKRLLNNPIKMKQLQELAVKDKGKKHKHKSKKKRKKISHHDSSSDSDSDDDSRHRHTDSRNRRHRDPSPQETREHYRDRSPYRQRETERRHQTSTRESNRGHRNIQSNGSSEQSRGSGLGSYRSSRSKESYRDSRLQEGPHSSSRSYRDSRSREGYSKGTRSGQSSVTRRMDPAELERKRQEMMASAKERDREREKRVRLYESEMKKEEEEALTSQNDFLKPLKVQSLTSSKTLEDRIHRNINSVQRTRSALNDSFMKR